MAKVTVVIGRFQAPELTNAHRALLNLAMDQSDAVLVLLGCAAFPLTERNPLSYLIREDMVRNYLALHLSTATFQILPVHNKFSDKVWSSQVDEIINGIHPFDDITLIGGRDSFIPSYSGKHKARVASFKELAKCGADKKSESATELREKVCFSETTCRKSFREGVIHASQSIYPRVLPCVDVAVTRETADGIEVLLGRKKGSTGYCFPGGFVNVGDYNYEAAAWRELSEETGLKLGRDFSYVTSSTPDDYRNTTDCMIMTMLFHVDATGLTQTAVAADDLEEVKWFKLYPNFDFVTPAHETLFVKLQNYLYHKTTVEKTTKE